MPRKTAEAKRHKPARPEPSRKASAKRSPAPPAQTSDLSETELDLLRHLQKGYQIDTDTLGGDVMLRGPKDEETIRPLSATRNTIEALQGRGLIAPDKSADPLRVAWRLGTGTKGRSSGGARKRKTAHPRKKH
jgi:hypothetical protein